MANINGIEVEFDLFDIETLRKYEKAYGRAAKKMQERPESGLLSDQIVRQCSEVKLCFDTIFGEGAGDRVCGEGYNFLRCLNAFEALTDEAIRQRGILDEWSMKTSKKYQKLLQAGDSGNN